MSSKGNIRFSVLEDDVTSGQRQTLFKKQQITITTLCVVFLVVILSIIFYYERTVKCDPNNSPILTNQEHPNLKSEAPFKILEYTTISGSRPIFSKQDVLSSPSTTSTRAPFTAHTHTRPTAPTRSTATAPIRAQSMAPTKTPSPAPTRVPSPTPSRAPSTHSSTQTTQLHSTGDNISVSNSPKSVESVTSLKQIKKVRRTKFTPQDGEKYYISSKALGQGTSLTSFFGMIIITPPFKRGIGHEFRFKSTGVPNHYNILDFENRTMTYWHFTNSAAFENENLTDGLKQEWIVQRDRGNAYVIKPAFNPNHCFIDVDAIRGIDFSTPVKPCDDYPNARGWIFRKVSHPKVGSLRVLDTFPFL